MVSLVHSLDSFYMKPKGIHCVEDTFLGYAIHDTNMASGVCMRGKLQCLTWTLLAEAATS